MQEAEKTLQMLVPEFPRVRAGILIVNVAEGIAGKDWKKSRVSCARSQKEILIAAA